MSVFLATTALSEFWDTSGRVVFLGRRCISAEQAARWASLDYDVLPSPWVDRDRFYRAAAYLDGCFERLLGRLADHLNGAHRESYSRRYWRVVLSIWLLNYLHSTYDRYVQLQDALARHPDLRTIVLDGSCFRVPTDTVGMIRGLKSDDLWNLQLISQLLLAMGHTFEARPVNRVGGPSGTSRHGYASRVLRRARTAVEHVVCALRPAGPAAVMSGMEIMDAPAAWRLALASRLRVIPIGPRPAGEGVPPVFDERRSGLATLGADDAFQRAAVACLPWFLPTVFLEGYEATRRRALAGWRRMPRVVVSATGWNIDETFKLFAAEAGENGARLVAVQHGGGYGVARAWPSEDVERRMSDMFVTWGWADDSPPRLGNLPHPKLSQFRARARRAPSGVLFVSAVQKRYVTRFNSSPLGTLSEEYLDGQLRFLTALTADVRRVVRLRPHPAAPHPLRHVIRGTYPEVEWEEGGALYESLSRARLVVIDHPVTSMLEALAANVPTILFWDARRWELRPAAEPYFDALRATGILQSSPEAAATQLIAVIDRVDEWWRGEEVRAARQRFVRRFAAVESDWQEAWLNAIAAEVAPDTLSRSRERGQGRSNTGV